MMVKGITIYIDEVQVKNDNMKSGSPPSKGDGRVGIGRFDTSFDGGYASLDLDEVLFFNQSLTDDEISQLYNI